MSSLSFWNSTRERLDGKPPLLDFFAGSGLASEGLKDFFQTVWANDICPKKGAVFCANHPEHIFELGSITNISGKSLPKACVSWGSFPCQDLSLAGNLNGISSDRSGLVWEWLRVMDEMPARPPISVAENVVGLISAANGKNFVPLHQALVNRGYKAGAVVIDAANWVPQSRKRVFIIAVKAGTNTEHLESNTPLWCHPDSIKSIAESLDKWVWWNIPKPNGKRKRLDEVIDPAAPCFDADKTDSVIDLIPQSHIVKLRDAAAKGQNIFPGYKRIRNGKQVLELRFDGLAGCLRTPQGGSSRQFLIIKENGSIKTRLLTVKEAAALMGVHKNYRIPGTYNDGYKAMGDAVCVPVVRYLAKHLLYPLSQAVMETVSI
jgi:DNA (cytosine-5)-methyltransferase 1